MFVICDEDKKHSFAFSKIKDGSTFFYGKDEKDENCFFRFTHDKEFSILPHKRKCCHFFGENEKDENWFFWFTKNNIAISLYRKLKNDEWGRTF